MPAWGKSALLVGLIFIGCWAAAIVYWRATDQMPGTGELAFCLVGLPLLLSGGVWLSRRLIEPPSVSMPGASTSAKRAAGGTEQGRILAILAGSLRLPCGSSPGEVFAAIKANKARPDLDPTLRDEDGFPLMTSRCSAADDDEMPEEISAWFAANGFRDVHFNEEQLRALILATQVTEDLASNDNISRQKLQLVPVTAQEWTVEQRHASGAWLVQSIAQSGWPADQITLAGDVHANSTLASVFNGARNDENPAELTMVVAFASNLGDETVSRWTENKTLFASSRPNGQIPGEGAAAIFVAPVEPASPAAGGAALLCSIEEGKRDSAADETRRLDPKLLQDLAGRAMNRGGIEPAEIALVVGDTGHRPNCTLELMELASRLSPQLDSAEDVVQTGVATASCGSVPSLAAVVLASHSAIELDRMTLWVSNSDQVARAVAVIRPH
jgi:hypothetical protein